MRASTALLSSLPTTIRSLLSSGPTSPAQSESVHGWIRSLRIHKNVVFAEVDDGTARVQAVLKGKARDEGITQGCGVRLVGALAPSRGKGQEVELVVDEAHVLGACDTDTYPIQKQHLPAGYLREHAHLRFRTAQTGAIMRVRDRLMREWHDWFEDNEFTIIHTPILTSSDCEGAGETFQVVNPVVAHPSMSSSGVAAASMAPGALNGSARPTPPISSTSALAGLGLSMEHTQHPSDISPATSSSAAQSPPPSPSPPSSSSRPSPSPSPTPSPLASDTFFPSPANLSVSAQLHLEAPTHALSRVYTLSPAFRAEPSQTARHLCEFYMLEAEVAWVDTLDALMDVVERGIRGVVREVVWGEGVRAVGLRQDLGLIRDHMPMESTTAPPNLDDTVDECDRLPLSHLVNAAARPFARITYTAALDLLRLAQQDNPELVVFEHDVPAWGEGLATEHERFLAAHFGGPVFITHYPRLIKPFYMLPSSADASHRPNPGSSEVSRRNDADANNDTVACFDLVVPGLGELVGGSLREHRLGPLLTAIQRAHLPRDEYEWYLDLRRYGGVPHGGWGMGWERFVCWVTGVGNVRDVVAFPRWRGSCKY